MALIVTKTSSKCHLSPGRGRRQPKLGSVVRPELRTPGPDRLVADHHTAGKHQLLNVAQAQRETVIQPHRVPDDLNRIPVALVPRRNRHNDQSSQPPHKVNNLTMPTELTSEYSQGPLVMVSHNAFNTALLRTLDPELDGVTQRTACYNQLTRVGGRWRVDFYDCKPQG